MSGNTVRADVAESRLAAHPTRRFQSAAARFLWILAHHMELTIGRATNRSTIGSLNNRVTDTKTLVPWLGGLEMCDIGEVAQ
jgi:hypothetical protein